MAVQERQARGGGYHTFSSRLPHDLYNTVNDWAWEHRMTFAKACAVLLEKAIGAEAGSEYKPEAGGGYCKTGSLTPATH